MLAPVVLEPRNPKNEIRNKFKYPNPQIQNGLVSDDSQTV
jgi:hypothetical protein